MRFKTVLILAVWLSAGLALVLTFAFVRLPGMAASLIETRSHGFLEPDSLEFRIQKIGVSNAVFSKIRISRGISIDRLFLDYGINGLSTPHLSRITLCGLTIHGRINENNRLAVEGVNFPERLPGNSPEGSPGSPLKDSPVQTGQPDPGFWSLLPGKILGLDPKILLENTTIVVEDARMVLDSGRDELVILLGGSAAMDSIDGRIHGGGTFRAASFLVPPIPMAFDLWLDLENNLENGGKKEIKFDAGIHSTLSRDNPKARYTIHHPNDPALVFDLTNPGIQARFHGTLLKSLGQINLALEQGRVRHRGADLVFSDLRLDSDVLVDFSGRAGPVSAAPVLSAQNITLKSHAGQVVFPWAGISGKIGADTDNRPVMDLILKGSRGEISSDPFKAIASGIEFDIPIRYPFAPKEKDGIKPDGNYSISRILYGNQYRLSTQGKIRQTGPAEVRVAGEAAVNALPDLRAEFSARMDFEREPVASVEFKTNLVHLKTSDLAAVIPGKFQAADIDMRVSAEGTAAFHHGRLTTFLELGVNDGRIVLPEVNLAADGINTRAAFTDLGSLTGVPGQILTIDSIEMNEVKLENARIRFTVENLHSLLIENIRFKWCNGLVSTESIRIPQDDAYSLTLYCDRLELTRLLKQVGGFNAQGNGTLNGRIPLLYSNGDISFDNGFLFSTPGSGGKIMIRNSDRIIAGIPMDNPQFAQLDLAREALKDFDYQWAKLIFTTFDNTLDLKMEIDGKPSKVLPFEYKREFNGFRRVDASSPGSLFEGITLDVNLKLPFNEVMEFGNRIQSFLK